MKVVEQFKRRILDLAIRGKLVPQDPNDEPASVLLERIKAEKAKLVKAGKIKKEKNPSEIVIGSDGAAYEKFKDGDSFNTEAQRHRVDVPFDLPQGWVWARLDYMFRFIDYRGKTPHKISDGIPLVTAKNVRQGYIDYSVREFISHDEFTQRQSRGTSYKGDILFTTEAPLGYVAIADLDVFSTGQRLITLQRYGDTDNQCIMHFMQSKFWQEYLYSRKTGTTVAGIKAEYLKEMFIPVPPLNEQKRIVAKIAELFAITDSLGEATDNLEGVAKRLNKKILDLAIRGKLVPQDPKDEPAGELVKRIAASHKSPCKNQCKPIYPPFEIPDSWEWVSLGAICEILDSKRKPVTKSNRKPGPYPYYGATCIQDFVSDFIFDEPLVLLGEDGAKWGKGDKSAFCVDGKIWVNNHAHVLRPCNGINHIYLVCTLDILDLMPYVTGTTVPKLNQEKMCDIQIPLPPLAEQKRIVAKIEDLRAVIKSLTT